MNTGPLVSVVLATRNRSSLLRRTVDSVLRQTMGDLELVVIDDASTDDTCDVLRKLSRADARVRFERQDRQRGAACARNRGIAEAHGAVVAFIDDDAEWLPGKLAAQTAALSRDTAAQVVYSTFVHVDGSGRTRTVGSPAAAGRDAARVLIRRNFIDTSVLAVRAPLLRAAGGFDETLPRLQDWDLALRLARTCRFAFVPDPLVTSHFTEGSISTRPDLLRDACRKLAAKYRPVLSETEHAVWLATLGHTLMVSGDHDTARHFFAAARSRDRTSLRAAGMDVLGRFPPAYALATRATQGILARADRARAAIPAPTRTDTIGPRIDPPPTGVDAVIVNWNGRRWLPQCLDALERSTMRPRIIVVDNASTDGSADYVASRGGDITLIPLDSNRGYAGGANAGLQAGTSRFALVMNPDVIVEPEYIERLSARFEADERVGVAQGKLYSSSVEAFLAGAATGEIIDSAGHVIRRSRMVVDRGQGERDDGAYEAEASVFSVCGAAMFVRRTMLDDIAIEGQYFAESFFAYKEDIDLCWRARILDWDVRYVPSAVAHHVRTLPYGRTAWSAMPVVARRHSWKNHYLLMLRNDRLRDILLALPWIAAWEIGRLAHALLRDRSVLPAYAQLLRELPAALRARRAVLLRRRASAADVSGWFGVDAALDGNTR